MQYAKNGFSVKVLAAYIAYPDAAKVNTAYSKNLAKGMYGAYAEIGFDWLYNKQKAPQFITFAFRCHRKWLLAVPGLMHLNRALRTLQT